MIRKPQFFALLSTVALSVNAQEFRDTAVPNSQISAVVRDVAQWHDMQYPDCRFVKAVGSNLVKKTSEQSVEHWTIAACSGRDFTYEVTVLDVKGGGVTNMVSNLDGEAIGSNSADFPVPDAAECAEMQKQFDAISADTSSNIDYSQLAQLTADLAACNSAPAAP